ncbi:MAG TPA: phosphoribosylaminoimidazolesuccinocarboxamide synthase [Mycobacteriales bacterium]|nr:phosphoribosylaminoimidazolesuccinocarboxamide synthase [Mycobacteriales bacterium]
MTGLEHLAAGKVRDMYGGPDGLLLVVASDRVSAYDYVLPTPIPDKGRVLTALSAWWFERLADLVPHHLVSIDDPAIPAEWRGRAMLVKRLEMLPVECVARGYLAGSGVASYRDTGAVSGVDLPPGLEDGSRLPAPIFTPTTKAPVGAHDEAMTYGEVEASVGADRAAQLRGLTLAVYARAAELAEARGILLADTKLEFGVDGAGVLTLGDEVLTPDSSRWWPADRWQPGRPQASYDKQFVRDWLSAHWDRRGEPPPLPPEIVEQTRSRYVGAYERITGLSFADWPGA